MSATGKIDPQNPPPWIKDMIARAVVASDDLLHTRAEVREAKGAGGATIVVLGAGTFAAPLPKGWSFHRGRPYEGRIRPKEGYDIHFRIDSHEDPDAAAGGEALMRYASEPEFKDEVKTPSEIVNDFLVSIPGKDAIGRDIVWKCVEPFRGTHVRELVFRCPLVNDELVEHRVSIARAISEWMGLGRFSPNLTELDRVANTEKLKRVNFQDLLLMRLPRDWKVQLYGEKDGNKEFVAEDPADRHNLWVNSAVMPMPTEAFARLFVEETATRVWTKAKAETEQPWADMNYETLPDGDLLITMAREDGEQHRFRRIRWFRYGIREGDFVWAEIDFVTPAAHIDHPDRPGFEALMDAEVRNAALLKPPTL